MEPTVRGAWTQSGIAAAPSRSRIAAAQNPEYGFNCARTSRSATAAGNGIFGCRDRAPKITTKLRQRSQRPKSGKSVAENPGRNALFGVASETCGLRRLDGGGCSLAKPVSNANNREFFGNSSPKQASNGLIATNAAKFDRDLR